MREKDRIIWFIAPKVGFLLSLFLSFYCVHKLIPVILTILFFVLILIPLITKSATRNKRNKLVLLLFSLCGSTVVLLYVLYKAFFKADVDILFLIGAALGFINSIALIVQLYNQTEK